MGSNYIMIRFHVLVANSLKDENSVSIEEKLTNGTLDIGSDGITADAEVAVTPALTSTDEGTTNTTGSVQSSQQQQLLQQRAALPKAMVKPQVI